jgi:hypothetical protein
VVYCKPPFGGPEYVLQYLGRYTHRVAMVSRPRGFRPEPLRRTVRKPLDLHGSHYPT